MAGAMSRGEKAFLLTTGHVLSFLCGMLTPMVLSRTLSVEALGTYRQVFLIIWIVGFAGSLGMDNGLFYFIRRNPDEASRASFTAMAFNLVTGGVIATLMTVFSGELGEFMNNPKLGEVAPWLALYLLALLPGQQLPALLVILGRIRAALIVNIVHSATLAAAAITGYVVFGSLVHVLQLLTAWAVVRILILSGLNLRLGHGKSTGAGAWLLGFKAQLRYALPVGASNLLAVSLRLDRFVVASFFPVAQFTRYSVGCFDLPVLPQAVNNLHDLTSIDMVEADREGKKDQLRAIWQETVRKIQLLTMPAVAFAWFFATELITLIFSAQYADSAGIFRWYCLIFLLTSIDSEILFRVFGKTSQGLALDALNLGVSFLLIVLGIRLHGAEGAIIGRLAAQTLTFGVRTRRAARLLDVSAWDMVPWKHAGATALVSVGAAAATHALPLHTGFLAADLALGAVVTGALYATGAVLGRLISPEEQAYIRSKLALASGATPPSL